MKHLRMLGLVVVAATALMAVIAGTARRPHSRWRHGAEWRSGNQSVAQLIVCIVGHRKSPSQHMQCVQFRWDHVCIHGRKSDR